MADLSYECSKGDLLSNDSVNDVWVNQRGENSLHQRNNIVKGPDESKSCMIWKTRDHMTVPDCQIGGI